MHWCSTEVLAFRCVPGPETPDPANCCWGVAARNALALLMIVPGADSLKCSWPVLQTVQFAFAWRSAMGRSMLIVLWHCVHS